jgi:hypothetical protein
MELLGEAVLGVVFFDNEHHAVLGFLMKEPNKVIGS